MPPATARRSWPSDPAKADEIAGPYEVDYMFLKVAVDDGGLTLTVWNKPEIRMAGQRGFFPRDETGTIVWIDLAGRMFRRTTR